MSDLIEVGQSELKDFRQCPLKWKFRWLEGYYQPVAGEASHRGTLWHAVMAAHYRFKQSAEEHGKKYTVDHAKAVMSGQIDLLFESGQASEEDMEILVWMAAGYLERYGVDEDWEIVAIEERLRVPLLDPDRPRVAPRFVLRFTADLLVRVRSLNGALAVVDNKTVASSGSWTTGDVDLDDQLGLYVGALARQNPKDPPLFAMLNQSRRDRLKRPMTLTERFFRPRSTRTRAEIDEILRDALADMARLDETRQGLVRASSSPNPRTCGWSCDFKEAHIALRKSGGKWSEALRILDAAEFSNDPEADPALANR